MNFCNNFGTSIINLTCYIYSDSSLQALSNQHMNYFYFCSDVVFFDKILKHAGKKYPDIYHFILFWTIFNKYMRDLAGKYPNSIGYYK